MFDMGLVKAIYAYRHFILASVLGEIKGRYARSRIGALWYVLHPLAMALIYALVLSEVLGAKIGGVESKAAYSIYLMAGISAWGLFQEITSRSIGIFVEYGNTLKKINFPRICLPIIVLGGALINQFFLLTSIIVIFVFYSHFPTIHLLALPIGILSIVLFAFGIGIILGVLNVFSRDVAQVMMVILNLWFWLTPIVYTPEVLPESLRHFLRYNPMTPVVQFYQDVLLYQVWPNVTSLLPVLSASLVLTILSMVAFRRASPEIVDVL